MANSNTSKAKVNSPQAASDWLTQGVHTVPLHPKSKKPKGGKGWNDLLVTQETIPHFFTHGDNIGALWGKPSNWVVDIDLDWDEACDVATYLLPETFIYGRVKRPASHYLYRCPEVVSSKRTLRSGSVIAEIRSTGSQSVIPPSIHPKGDRYEITHDIDFIEIPRLELERYVDSVASAAVFVRRFPEGGSRHDYIHAITGALMHGGWPSTRVATFMDAIIQVTRDIDSETYDRKTTVENTIFAYKRGSQVKGWPSLGQWLDKQEIQALRRWLIDRKGYSSEPPREIIDFTYSPSPFYTDLMVTEGLVGDLSEWSRNQSFLLQPSFDLAMGLMSTAIATCNKYVVETWGTPLQPYFMLLAPTAAGKGAALNSAYKFSTKIGLDDHVFQGFQSYFAMLDKLAEVPYMVHWLWDEAARQLASARSPSSQDFITLTHLISLYGRANDEVPGSPGRKNPIPKLIRPFLTVMATAQPAQLIEAISAADVATGFLNRLVLFDSGDKAPEANLRRNDVFPSRLKKVALDMQDHEPLHGSTTVIKFEGSPSPYNHFRDFDAVCRMKAAEGNEAQIYGRGNQNALILAGIVAVGINSKRPKINIALARWATDLVEWSIKCWMIRIGISLGATVREKASRKVESIIRRAKEIALRNEEGRDRTCLEEGRMPRSILMRMSRDLNKRELDDILDQLIEARVIGASEEESGFTVYWPRVG